MLVDRARIFVRSGKGGDGCMSFRREKFIPKGGPNGGDGGDGGSVILVGDQSIDTLLPVTHRPHYRATHGQQGKGSQMHGANGEDCIVKVPLGTLVRLEETEELLADISEDGQELIVASGGKGGWGNEHFKSSTNQAPTQFLEGGSSEEKCIWLSLKLFADIGIIGLPNAGKSMLLSTISEANSKFDIYPFTTLYPILGVIKKFDQRIVVADIPGLIKGAHEGRGLGDRFLAHIERCKVLLHVIDCSEKNFIDNYSIIRNLFQFQTNPFLIADDFFQIKLHSQMQIHSMN